MSGGGPFDRQLRFAIEHKRLIEVEYDGRLRVAEPHDYGVKNGSPKDALCAVSTSTFTGSRGDSSQQHFTWDEIYARVSS